MEKIIQLSNYEYDRLAELASLNKQQIEDKAIAMYKEKGVASVNIKIEAGRNNEYSYTHNFNCFTSVWYKDDKFFISEKLRDGLSKYIKERVLDEVMEKYGEPIYLINKYSKQKRELQIVRFILWTIAVSGWAAFAGCLYKILM
ncbi:hypothetical protein ACGE0T_14130 [Parabacteroides sp. APC149_11_2_Y6]